MDLFGDFVTFVLKTNIISYLVGVLIVAIVVIAMMLAFGQQLTATFGPIMSRLSSLP